MFASIASALVSLGSAAALAWLLVSLTTIASNLTNNVPGPRLAKITRLWKFTHVVKGTYKQQLRELHAQHGPLIQIGPREYSISPPYASVHHRVPSQSAPILADICSMANIFRREADIEACNDAFMEALHALSSSGEEFNVAELIARYAYDVMFATTASHPPTFLRKPLRAAKIGKALKDWKLHAVLSGGYFRLQPLLTKISRLLRVTDLQEIVGEHLNATSNTPSQDATEAPSGHTQEACIALLLAGSDPVIVHLVSSLWYIYSDPGLVQRLRNEMDSVGLAEQAKIKDLIQTKASMPLLYAVLQESLRLHLPAHSSAIKYRVPDAGVQINFQHIPSGVSHLQAC
ncbi:cytochrome P450 [Neohortaea acidophila]|uniref:Cytochrome P450 n=1 Tax=Neohortaea acidophila TaxID=245834 RepID=A0A6A6PGX9_9PEZI|nr:cytochrome P450 [Neohortaea acidophila]KAF2478974.1 cytochrome P450 [Neohortaea acidophila]